MCVGPTGGNARRNVKVATQLGHTQFAPNAASFARILGECIQQCVILALFHLLRIVQHPTTETISFAHFLTSVTATGK